MGEDRTETSARKHVRYKADPAQFAQIDFNIGDGRFECEVVALIHDESYRGCCLIGLKHEKFVRGARCRIVISDMNPMITELKWISYFDERVCRMGFYFLK